ncbi:MAG: hypothetical protein QW112_00165, partial [Candidatus Micrarchaeia archaeon]
EKVESVLTARGKSVTVTPVVDGVCRDVLYSECLTQVGDTPIIKLKYGKTNSTQFYTFYKIEAIVSGDAQYLSKCSIAELLS